jgi:transcriptional regulator GlxA family with amidase domain
LALTTRDQMNDSDVISPHAFEPGCTAGEMRGPAARDVLFLLLNDLVLMDLAGPMDAFRAANAESPGSYRLRFVAPRPCVTLAGGPLVSGCEAPPDKLARGTILVIPGVAGGGCPIDLRDPATRHAIDWLRGAAPAVHLLCVSSGGLLAAHAGLLGGRQCTTHPAHVAELRRVAPSARVLDNRAFVEDGFVFTSVGVSAAVDLALHVIGRQLGTRVATNVAQRLTVYPRRPGSDCALSPCVAHRNHLHPAVLRVQDAVTRDPAARWTATDLSAAAYTSTRNLSRLFHEHDGSSPRQYVQRIRLALAKQLVMQSRLDLKSVAARAGFRSAQHLRRAWLRWEERPPSALRGRSVHAARRPPAAVNTPPVDSGVVAVP